MKKEHIVKELNDEKFTNHLKTLIIEPSICHVLEKLYPYIIIAVVLLYYY